MEDLLAKVQGAMGLLREAENLLYKEGLELKFQKKNHGGILLLNSRGTQKEVHLPETSFLLVTFLLYYQQEFADIIPYEKVQLALQELKHKEKIPIATLRAEISRSNDIFRRGEVPVSIRSKREKGYYIEINAGKVSIDGDYQRRLIDISWKVALGDVVKSKQHGSPLKIISDEAEFHEITVSLLSDPGIEEISCLKDTPSMFSVPIDCVADNKSAEAVQSLQKRRNLFLERLEKGLEYKEIVNRKHFQRYLKELGEKKARLQIAEIKEMLRRYPHYYIFPADVELPLALIVFGEYFSCFTASSWSDYRENVLSLFLTGKNSVMVIHTIFEDIYNSPGMNKWRKAIGGMRGHYIELVENWVDKALRMV